MARFGIVTVTAMISVATATPVHAAPIIISDSGDTAWLLASLIVGLVTTIPALLLLFSSVHGRTEMPRMIASSVAGMALVTLLYFFIGYSLIFDLTTDSAVSGLLGGGTHWMMNLMGTLREGTTVPETGFAAFQLGFVLVATGLLSAALAPRARAGWLLGFTGLWFLLVLVPVSRWIWGGGWLSGWGAIDTSGGLTIFYCAGASALVAMAMVGSNDGDEVGLGEPVTMLGGAALLLIGLLAFSGGATLGAGDNAAVAILAMLTCASTAALIVAAIRRRLDAHTLGLGLLGGTLAATTAGDGLSIGGAILMGVLAALAVIIGPRLMPKRLSWHDRGDLVTAMTGATKAGAFFTAIFLAFVPFGGSGYADGMDMIDQIVAQTIAIIAIAGWSVIGTAIAALMMGMVVPMRGK